MLERRRFAVIDGGSASNQESPVECMVARERRPNGLLVLLLQHAVRVGAGLGVGGRTDGQPRTLFVVVGGFSTPVAAPFFLRFVHELPQHGLT